VTHAWTRISNAGLALAAVAIIGGTGCEEDTAPHPNSPPETFITGGPVEGARTPHHAELFWRGADFDGTTTHYDYILDTYSATIAAYSQISVQIPTVDDPRWVRIAVASRIFVLQADVLRGARTDPPPILFDRWHTFFVRAVDNDGGIDTTPEVRTFQAFTEAPSVSITAPVVTNTVVTLPHTSVMHWIGTDPLGSVGDFQDPHSARWVLLRATLDGTGHALGFPDSLYALAESRWSPFQDWNTTNGRTAVLRNLVPAGPAQQAYVFAVQAKDDGGAITPNFDGTSVATSNYAALIADGTLDAGPRATIFLTHTRVDTLVAPGGNPPTYNYSTTADSVAIKWNQPDASRYGGQAREARYGWNLTDVLDDAQWTAWAATSRSAPKRRLSSNDAFFLQCRDDVGRGNHALDQVTTVRVALQHLVQ
jgi:hypothetical protein